MPILTANQLRAYNNVPATPYSPASIKLGNLLQLLLGGGSSSISRFYDESALQFIYVSTTGSDTTGDGLTTGTAYATVNRAMKDLPDGWTADVWIQLAAGTYTGAQSWVLNALPGAKTVPSTSATTGRLYITGDLTVVQTLTGGSAGVIVAGKLAQYTYAVGAYTATVTDGSHYIKEATGIGTNAAQISGKALRASATPNLIVLQTATTAFTAPQLMTWTSIFSGAITMQCPAFSGAALPWFNVQAVRFNAACTARGTNFRVCRFDIATSQSDVVHTSNTFFSGTQTLTATTTNTAALFPTLVNSSLFVAGSLVPIGSINSTSGNVFAGAPSLTAKIMMGGTATLVTSAAAPAVISAFSLTDFEGTGNGVRCVGGSITSGATAAATFALSNGSPIILAAGAFVYGANAWTGTGGLPSTIASGAALDTNGGYVVTNSVSAGQDVTVGELAVQAVATRPTTSPVQLARYS